MAGKGDKKSSAEYWEGRIANTTWAQYNSIEDRNRALIDFYEEAGRNIREALYKIAEKHSRDGVLSLSDMHKENRLKRLNSNIEKIVERLGREVQEHASGNMQEGFSKTYENVRSALGEIDFALPNKKLMEKLMNEEWAGGNFSERLWENQKRLAMALNSELLLGLQQGKTATEIAVAINGIMGKGFNAAHRLVRTESMHYLNSAALQGYKDRGVAHVRIWAAIDERTCETCGTDGYHGKIYPIEEAPVLPFHPNCRCTYLPVVEEEMEGIELNDSTDKWAEEAKEELLKSEESLGGRERETMEIYNAYGKFIMAKRGESNSVRLSLTEYLKLNGAVVTHNHPSGGSFSANDIKFLKNNLISELRVSTKECVYYMRKPRRWPKEINTGAKIEEELLKIKKGLKAKYQKLYNEGKINKIQRHRLLSDEANKIFAERYGLEYGRETYE